jgi:hypothetical protein
MIDLSTERNRLEVCNIGQQIKSMHCTHFFVKIILDVVITDFDTTGCCGYNVRAIHIMWNQFI